MGTITKNPAEKLRQAAARNMRTATAGLRGQGSKAKPSHQTMPALTSNSDDNRKNSPNPRREPDLSPHLAGVWLALDFERPAPSPNRSPSSRIAQWVVEPSSIEALAHGARLADSRAKSEGEGSIVFTEGGTALVALTSRGDLPLSIEQMAKQGVAPNMVRLEASPSKQGGLQRFYVRKKKDKTTGQYAYQGITDTVRDGTYPFVLDQSQQIIIPPTVAADGHAGAHRNLAGGLMVLFAGELTIATTNNVQRVVSFSPKSGNYRTPMTLPIFEAQARSHPLLKEAEFRPLSDVLAELSLKSDKLLGR